MRQYEKLSEVLFNTLILTIIAQGLYTNAAARHFSTIHTKTHPGHTVLTVHYAWHNAENGNGELIVVDSDHYGSQ